MSANVNKPTDLKQKEADVNRKLQLYGIVSAFQAGKVPSVSKCRHGGRAHAALPIHHYWRLGDPWPATLHDCMILTLRSHHRMIKSMSP